MKKMFKNQDIRVFPLGVDSRWFDAIEKFKKICNIEKPKLIYVEESLIGKLIFSFKFNMI